MTGERLRESKDLPQPSVQTMRDNRHPLHGVNTYPLRSGSSRPTTTRARSGRAGTCGPLAFTPRRRQIRRGGANEVSKPGAVTLASSARSRPPSLLTRSFRNRQDHDRDVARALVGLDAS